MRTLKQLLFAVAVMICFSMTASAQKDGDKKPPPKKDPPIIVVEPKKPKDDKPKDDKKKPEAFVLYFKNE
ncbi:MAG: hypothetical protein ACR2HG_10645 [Pyrinomonadaceae bacterium]